LLENLQGGGIGFGGGPTDPPNNNMVLDRNILNNIDLNAHDLGGLYYYGAFHGGTGNQITNNIVNNNPGNSLGQTKAIYLDNESSNVLVSGNLCRGCGAYGVQYHGGDHNTVTNNIFDLSSGAEIGLYQVDIPSFPDYGMQGNTFTKNIVYSSGCFASKLWTIYINSDDSLPNVSSNLYYSATGCTIPNTGAVDSSPVYANPQFTNPNSGDYSMPHNSPAFTSIGFVPLPTDQGPLPRYP
jgi:parallel beta-helix repeat protein